MTNENNEIQVSSGLWYLIGLAVGLIIINLFFLASMYKDMNLQLFIINDKLNTVNTTLATDAVNNEWSFFKLKQEINRNKKD